ncbi:glycosyl transferase group 1 [Desulfurobacterium thermolithotrophum DSM 11699]|uniref:Glycosyl transferase group 1 n=1 Tax=Desulfurobacterium thermolithotrophum (strain DSM 11699 / BSA) TaxID=868864 RepID=F0S167_DESTD|nr:glycosyltransferase family 1 protein [Desulfurobacterium thermolithotrophum]ADY73945.1 glycosyl transferase group 1 [Desulfurobacterium thermolithotrophum DSM 11699]
MKIGIYGNLFLGKRTGIGNYIYNLCKHLESFLPEAEFFIFSQRKPDEIPFGKNFSVIVEENPFLRKLPFSLWLRLFSFRLINQYNLDFFWSGMPIMPLYLDQSIKKIITVYDLNLYLVPETMKTLTKINHKLFFKKSILESDVVVTISKGTAQRLKKFLGVETDVVVYPGVDDTLFYPRKREEVESFLKSKGINSKYILSVSTLEPRKNLELLVESFLELKEEGYLQDFKLVLVGNKGWKINKLYQKIKRFKEEIIYLGYIPDEELPLLYSGATVFVLPSMYEGFGIPVLEARACGCCVITSNIPELKEAGGKGSIYINPQKNILKDTLFSFINKNIDCNKEKLRENLFFWKEEAKKLAKIFINYSSFK